MSRYIDADAMKKWIDEYVSVFKKSYNKDIKVYIDYQPSIDIVRCKECKYWLNNSGLCKHWSKLYGSVLTKADDFCSYGEREGE